MTDIDEDHRGNLWIGTYGGGLNHYDQKTGRFVHHARTNAASGEVASDFINAVTADDDGSVWLGTGDRGVIHLTLDSGGKPRWKRYDLTDPASSTPPKGQNFVLALHKDREGYVWAGTIRGGLTRIDQDQSFPWQDTEILLEQVSAAYKKAGAEKFLCRIMQDHDHAFCCASQTLKFLELMTHANR